MPVHARKGEPDSVGLSTVNAGTRRQMFVAHWPNVTKNVPALTVEVVTTRSDSSLARSASQMTTFAWLSDSGHSQRQ